jgi:eukaryotic-like serine/threonine-protein kinase
MSSADDPTLVPGATPETHATTFGAVTSVKFAEEAYTLPTMIARYRILRLLGEGGMGAVYEAKQESPKRTVALKVIRAGFADGEMLRRFETETQALGRLQHTGIAQIYDAGTAETPFGKQPYFAMELGNASAQLRGELGESLSSVQNFDTPLEQATTSSFEALKAYSLGMKVWNERGDVQAIPFFQRAIELNPTFAIAYGRLGEEYSILGEVTKSADCLNKAFQLRDRVTEREKYAIASQYYYSVTGEIEKGDQVSELWAQSYPRDSEARLNLGFGAAVFGQYEKSNAETREALRVDPDSSIGYANLIQGYAFTNQLNEAKAVYQEAVRRNPDNEGPHGYMYGVAFLEHDTGEMERQVKWAADHPSEPGGLLSQQSDTEAFYGRLRSAREFSQRAVQAAERNDLKETAEEFQTNAALREAEFGNAARAQEQSVSALAMTSQPDMQVALAFARAGDPTRAEKLADEGQKKSPQDTIVVNYWLPTVRAAIAIDRGDPSRAVEFLKVAAPYELGDVSDVEFGILLYPAYVRGQAYLLGHQGAEAAAEFQKFLDHPTMVANNPLCTLAHLGLARAYALQGNIDKSRAAYQDFLTVWKDADQDIPILKQARAEYTKLR